MSLNPADIKKIAHLARIHIPDDKIQPMADEFNNILELVDKMNQAQCDTVEPLSHPFDATQALRSDEVTENNQRSKMQAIAPEVKAGLYIVPQFIETE